MGRPKSPRSPITCIQCGLVFYVHPYRIKKGKVKFCSISCGTTYRNLTNNPTNDPAVRKKISRNHKDVSGKNNPMYGRRGKDAPGYVDGRNKIVGNIWRKIALTYKEPICVICKDTPTGRRLHIHHIDKDRSNNTLDNLQVLCVTCHLTVVHLCKRNKEGRFV